MSFFESFKNRIFSVNEDSFEESALELFYHQYRTNSVLRQYADYLDRSPSTITRLDQIPFLPISFYKTHPVRSGSWTAEKIFLSSGTTSSDRSKQYVREMDHYLNTARRTFEMIYGELANYQIIALLPSYQEQGDSSLIAMVDHFISHAAPGSGYFQKRSDISEMLISTPHKILIGVSYALLDLIDSGPIATKNCIIMETGGMKGRRKELTRYELHARLRQGFGIDSVHAEYGMTELMTQAYASSQGYFHFPPWAKVLIRDANDPFSFVPPGTTGGINIIDLSNTDTCGFIETMDLGKIVRGQEFEVLGRFDNSDLRGCNLLAT